jgi:glycosyltransferase involved in cell wall biosynthesis
MRIVHVITRLYRAGAEENTLASCRAQAANGHEVHLVHGRDFDPAHEGEIGRHVQLHCVSSLVHPLDPRHDLRATIDLTRLFRELAPDIVHTHQSKAGILGRIAARWAQVPHLVHGVHILPFVNTDPLRRAVYLAAEKLAARGTDAFIDVSAGMRDLCVAHRIGRPDTHHVVHSGFRLAQFREARPVPDWRRLLRLAPHMPKPPILLMMAAFEPRKRHAEFIEVLPRITARFPDLRLILVGDGPCRAAVDAKIAALGLDGHVIRTGYRRDPERLVALADLCLLTSSREGLPRVILQYLAAGKPCVTSDLPGLDEVIEDGRNAIIAPPGDMAATADCIADLLGDPARRAALAAAAAETDLSSWDVDLMCDRIEAIYAKLAAEAAPQSAVAKPKVRAA